MTELNIKKTCNNCFYAPIASIETCGDCEDGSNWKDHELLMKGGTEE